MLTRQNGVEVGVSCLQYTVILAIIFHGLSLNKAASTSLWWLIAQSPRAMNLQSLSSNWKHLQQQLDKNKPPKRKTSTVVGEGSSSTRKRKKLNTSKNLSDMSRQIRQNPAGLELWAMENDISAADVRLAYGTSVPATLLATNRDEINQGLSPTYASRITPTQPSLASISSLLI